MARLTIDFFHDVVCDWCFNLSSRMRRLSAELDLKFRHRTVFPRWIGFGADRHHARTHHVRSVSTLVIRKTGSRIVNLPREDLFTQLRTAQSLVV